MTRPAGLAAPQPFEHLARHARSKPTALALATTSGDFTFRQVHDHVQRVAGMLREMGIRPGDIVATDLANDLNLVFMEALFHEAAIGCIFPGAVTLNNPVGFDWLLAREYAKDFPRERTLIVDEMFMLAAAQAPAADAHRFADMDSVCRLVFSSGTTGAPVAVPFTIRQMEGRIAISETQWGAVKPVMSLVGIIGGLGFVHAYSCVAHGDKFICAGPTAKNLAQIRRNFVATVIGSPVQLRDLVREATHESVRMDDLVRVCSTGAHLPADLVDEVATVTGAQVINVYGSTETGTVSMQPAADAQTGDVGLFDASAEIQIVDDEDEPVPDGVIGIIRWRRPFQADSYYRTPDGARTALRDGWFYPGDMGLLAPDGHLHLAGRSSEIINAGGVKLDPSRIDAALQASGLVDDVAAFAHSGPRAPNGFSIAVVPSPSFDTAALERIVAAQARGLVPDYVIQVTSIPRGPTGKIRRFELTRRLRDHLSHQPDVTP